MRKNPKKWLPSDPAETVVPLVIMKTEDSQNVMAWEWFKHIVAHSYHKLL